MKVSAPNQFASAPQTLRRSALALAGLALCLLVSAAASAQGLIQSLGEATARFYDPQNNYYFWLRHLEGDHIGNTEPFTSLGGTHYVPRGDGIVMFDGQIMLTNDGALGTNLGAIHRIYMSEDDIFGAGFWVDFGQSLRGSGYQQVGLSLEWLRCDRAFRGNLYAPFGDQRTVIAERQIGFPGTNNPSFNGNNIITGGQLFRTVEYAMPGFDLEYAHTLNQLHLPLLEAFLGGYFYETPFDQGIVGIKGGLRGYLANNIGAEFTVSSDEKLGTNFSGGVTWFFGGPGGSTPCGPQLRDKLTGPVIRNEQIAVNVEERPILDDRVVMTRMGAPITVLHVNDAGAGVGDGTFENPFGSLDDADAANNAGFDIVHLHADSRFSNQSFTILADQRFLGEDPGAAIAHMVVTDQLGTIPLPRATAGTTAPLIRNNAGNILTLPAVNTDFAEVSGVRLDGRNQALRGIAALTGSNDIFISRTDIRNFTQAGVEITPSNTTTIGQDPFGNAGPVNFANNANDVILNATDTTIGNYTSTGAGTSISVDNIMGFARIGTIGPVNITNVQTGIVLNNAQAGADVDVTDTTITNVNVAGIVSSNAKATSDTDLTDITINGGGGDGIRVTGAAGGSQTDIGGAGAMDGFNIANIAGDGIVLQNNFFVVASEIVIDGNDGTPVVGDGLIDSVGGNGITIIDSSATIDFTTIRDPDDNGIDVTNNFFSQEVIITDNLIDPPGGNGINVVNSSASTLTITATDNDITSTGTGFSVSNDGTGTTDVTFDDNDVTSLNGNGFEGQNTNPAATSLLSLDINENLFTANTGTGILIGDDIPGGMSGTINVVTFFENNIRDAGDGGMIFNRVTFDSDGLGGAVLAGDTPIGSLDRISGDGLRLFSPEGTLDFGDLDITNANGTGLFVDTKTEGTTFTLDTDAGSTVDTINGAAMNLQAMNLDPLTLGLGAADPFEFDSVTSTNSATVGAGFDTVSGDVEITLLEVGGVGVGGAGVAGLFITDSDAEFHFDTVVINSGNGVRLIDNDGDVNFNVDLGGAGSPDLTINNSFGTGFFADYRGMGTGPGTGTGTVNFNVDVNAVNTIDATGAAINVTDTTIAANGALIFDTVSSTGANQNGVRFSEMTTSGLIEIGTVTVMDVALFNGAGLRIENSEDTFSFDSISIDNSNTTAQGVNLTNNPLATINFNRDLIISPAVAVDGIADLNIVTSTGTGFFANDGGTVNFNTDLDGNNTITATAGRAINVNNTSLDANIAETPQFDTVSSTGAEEFGVRFNDMPMGTEVRLGNVTINSTQAGGSPFIPDASLLLTNNTAAGVVFEFDSVTIDNDTIPGGAGGVHMENNSTATINFNRDLIVNGVQDGGGNLDITTSSGTGFFADTTGTVTVNSDADGANSIVSTSATAINFSFSRLENTMGTFTFDNVESTDGGQGGATFSNVSSTSGVSIDELDVTDAQTVAGLAFQNSVGGADLTVNELTIDNSGGGAAGVLLNNNLNSTIDFNPLATSFIDITTSTGNGFRATNGGEVLANMLSATNTVESFNSTAVLISGIMSDVDLIFDQVNAGDGVDNPTLGVSLNTPAVGSSLIVESGTIRLAANGTGVSVLNLNNAGGITVEFNNIDVVAATDTATDFSFNFNADGVGSDITVSGMGNTATVGGISPMTMGSEGDGVNEVEANGGDVNGNLEVNGNNKAF